MNFSAISNPLRPGISFAELATEFQAAKPFPNVVIDNFLADEVAQAVAAEFPEYNGPVWNEYNNAIEVKKANNHWDDHTRVLAAPQEMQVRHIRTELWANNKGQWAYLNQIRGAGITALLTMGRPNGLGGTVPQLVNVAATQVPNAIYAFEGANEVCRRDWDRSIPRDFM